MKNLILNLLTFIAFGVFFLLATATSEDECFYNMEVERTATGLAVTNNNDFNYTNLELIISKTVINDSDATPWYCARRRFLLFLGILLDNVCQ